MKTLRIQNTEKGQGGGSGGRAGVLLLNKERIADCKELFYWMDGWMEGLMTCNFTSFSKVFQSYQDNGWIMIKGCVQWNLVCGWKDFCL